MPNEYPDSRTRSDDHASLLNSQIESLRIGQGLWSVTDWDQYRVLLDAIGVDPAGDVSPELVARILSRHAKAIASEDPNSAKRISILLGLEHGFENKSEAVRNRAISSLYHDGRSSGSNKLRIKRANQKSKELLVKQILNNPKDRPTAGIRTDEVSEEQSNSDQFAAWYVERPEEQADFTRWYSSISPILLLAGDSGNGKSTIASVGLSEIRGHIVKYKVDATNINSMTRSLNAITKKFAISVTEAAATFNAILAQHEKDGEPTIVLFDNVERFDDIESMVLWASRSVITAEHRVVPSDMEYEVIEVHALNHRHALEMIQKFRPKELVHDCAEFARLVGRKPRIIVDCLGMFSESDMSLSQMNEVIIDEDGMLIRQGGTSSRSVHKLYERYYDTLESTDAIIAMYLACICHLGVTQFPREIPTSILMEFVTRNPEYGSLSRSVSVRAEKELAGRFLIRQVGPSLEMHGVTSTLFRQATRTYKAEVIDCLISAYLEFRQQTVSSHRAVLYTELLNWAPVLGQAISSMSPQYKAALDVKSSDLLLTDVTIGMKNLGRFRDLIPILNNASGFKRYVNTAYSILGSVYQSGQLTREEFVAALDRAYDRNPILLVKFALEYMKSNAQYSLRSFMANPKGLLDLSKISEGDRMSIFGVYCRFWFEALDWLGGGRLAISIMDQVEEGRISRNTVESLQLDALMIEISARHHDVPNAEKYHLILKSTVRRLELTDEYKVTESALLAATAWVKFAGSVGKLHESLGVSDAFLDASNACLEIGENRRAMALYVMAKRLVCFSHDQSHSKDQFAYLETVRLAIDDPHLGTRIEIFEQTADMINKKKFLWSGLNSVLSLACEAKQNYDDIVTFGEGLAVYVVGCIALGIDPGTKKNDLSQMMHTRSAVDESQSDLWDEKFDTWLTAHIERPWLIAWW